MDIFAVQECQPVLPPLKNEGRERLKKTNQETVWKMLEKLEYGICVFTYLNPLVLSG